MTPYLGVLIEQSLADPAILDRVEVVRRQRDPHGSWVFLLVRVRAEDAGELFPRFAAALRRSEPWYAHFFRGDELVVVFGDAVLSTRTDSATWGEVIAHGRALGIPLAQLDFDPHTPAQVEARFGPLEAAAPDRELPAPIAALVDRLAGMPGAVAVVLGGSRAMGQGDAHSDWDLGVYYRGALDTAALAALGEVHPPGRWGRIMNGGAWLSVEGAKVDVLFRDLDVVEHWSRRADAGEYDVDGLLGYLAGLPTYSLRAELVACRTLRGAVERPAGYPPALSRAGAERWRFHRDFSLHHAHMLADRGNVAGAVGETAKAAMEAAHGRCCARGVWTLNEKRLLAAAGLEAVHAKFTAIPQGAAALRAWVDEVAALLAVP